MQTHEYMVVPAPLQGEKARNAKTTEDRFALALANAINQQARQGWEYVRGETLPTEERAGLTKRRTVYVNLLVFRRPVGSTAGDEAEAAAAAKPVFRLGGLSRVFAAPAPDGAAPPVGPATGKEAP